MGEGRGLLVSAPELQRLPNSAESEIRKRPPGKLEPQGASEHLQDAAKAASGGSSVALHPTDAKPTNKEGPLHCPLGVIWPLRAALGGLTHPGFMSLPVVQKCLVAVWSLRGFWERILRSGLQLVPL